MKKLIIKYIIGFISVVLFIVVAVAIVCLPNYFSNDDVVSETSFFEEKHTYLFEKRTNKNRPSEINIENIKCIAMYHYSMSSNYIIIDFSKSTVGYRCYEDEIYDYKERSIDYATQHDVIEKISSCNIQKWKRFYRKMDVDTEIFDGTLFNIAIEFNDGSLYRFVIESGNSESPENFSLFYSLMVDLVPR
jgi:hypothetical protein